MTAVAASSPDSLVERRARPAIATAAMAYGGAALVSSAAAFVLLQLWRADLHVPFAYGADATLHAMAVKAVTEHGWYLRNPNLGAPGSLELFDYPVWANDTIHLLTVRFMALFTGDWALIANLYFLLGFPVITLTAMTVLRRLAIAPVPAAAGAVLYSFLPSRLLNGEGHLFLDVFYQVPFLVLLLVWVCGSDPPLTSDGARPGRPRLRLRSARSIAALGVCLLSGSTSLYYSSFGACLLVAGGVWASVDRRSLRNALSGIALAGTLAAVVVANGLPTLIHQARHGRNEAAAPRSAGEAEVFGMRMAELLLPARGHRIPAFARLDRRYQAGVPGPVEPKDTSLGTVGAAGFLGPGFLFLKKRSTSPDDPLPSIVTLNGLALLLATVGGLGSLVALLATPQIRTYARMNVLIGFFALFAVARALDTLGRKRPRAGLVAAIAVMVLGLLDQATSAAIPEYEAVKRKYRSDRDLVAYVESTLGPGTIVFELPYIPFPEAPPLNAITSFDLFRPYLHSRTLRWTYPAMRGRSSDLWARDVSSRTALGMVDALTEQHARGIVILRDGYRENPPAIETELEKLLRAPPVLSADGLVSFFDISAYAPPAWLAALPLAQRARTIELASHPLAFRWTDGCYELEEPNAKESFRWCSNRGSIGIRNELDYARRVRIAGIIVAPLTPAKLTLDGLVTRSMTISPDGTPFDATIEVPPGDHDIRFQEDGTPVDAPADPRTLAWRIHGFTSRETTELEPR